MAVTALLTLLAAAATDVPVLLVLGAVLTAWLSIALSTGAGM